MVKVTSLLEESYALSNFNKKTKKWLQLSSNTVIIMKNFSIVLHLQACQNHLSNELKRGMLEIFISFEKLVKSWQCNRKRKPYFFHLASFFSMLANMKQK